MVDPDAQRVSKKQLDSGMLDDAEEELLHDYKGVRYLINDAYLTKQLDRRVNSPDKTIALIAAAQILRTNLNQLTDKQKQVIIGAMEGKSLREIAKEMNIHYTTVQEHLSIAKKKLAGLISNTKQMIQEGLEDAKDKD